jgi:hypothetical protein
MQRRKYPREGRRIHGRGVRVKGKVERCSKVVSPLLFFSELVFLGLIIDQ